MLQLLNLLNFIIKPRLSNLQRFQAFMTLGFMSGIMFLPHRAFAQNPLGNGAGQLNNGGQCNVGFWFLRDLNTAIAQIFGGLGGADETFCQVINIVILGSIFGVCFVILWAIADHYGNQTPFKKAFDPFLGFLMGIAVVWMVLGIAFFGSTFAGGGIQNQTGIVQ